MTDPSNDTKFKGIMIFCLAVLISTTIGLFVQVYNLTNTMDDANKHINEFDEAIYTLEHEDTSLERLLIKSGWTTECLEYSNATDDVSTLTLLFEDGSVLVITSQDDVFNDEITIETDVHYFIDFVDNNIQTCIKYGLVNYVIDNDFYYDYYTHSLGLGR